MSENFDRLVFPMEYRGYHGDINRCTDGGGYFYGKILGISNSVSYEGNSIEELHADFVDAVDDYVEHCEEKDIVDKFDYKKVPVRYLSYFNEIGVISDVDFNLMKIHLQTDS